MAVVKIAYEMGLDGKIASNRYRDIKDMSACAEGRLETSLAKRDYMGVNTFFYCPDDPTFIL
jgi:hypothetical protein